MGDSSDVEWTCTAQRRNGRFCGRAPIPGAPFPICYQHAGTLLEFVREEIGARIVTGHGQLDVALRNGYTMAYLSKYAPNDFLATAAQQREQRREAEPARTVRSCVYYVRVGDLIKIGTTTSLAKRMDTYPPHAELLATEPGDREVEQDRLLQFEEYHAARLEWFHPAKPLMDHIARLNPEPDRSGLPRVRG